MKIRSPLCWRARKYSLLLWADSSASWRDCVIDPTVPHERWARVRSRTVSLNLYVQLMDDALVARE